MNQARRFGAARVIAVSLGERAAPSLPGRRPIALPVVTISELAARTGVTPRALRHYEAQGLLRTDRRRGGGRLYTAAEADHAVAVVRLRALGVSIPQILDLTAPGRSPAAAAARLEALLRRRVADLEAEAQAVRDALARLEAGDLASLARERPHPA